MNERLTQDRRTQSALLEQLGGRFGLVVIPVYLLGLLNAFLPFLRLSPQILNTLVFLGILALPIALLWRVRLGKPTIARVVAVPGSLCALVLGASMIAARLDQPASDEHGDIRRLPVEGAGNIVIYMSEPIGALIRHERPLFLGVHLVRDVFSEPCTKIDATVEGLTVHVHGWRLSDPFSIDIQLLPWVWFP